MAEGTSNDNSWESWFGGWVEAAKQSSNTALEFVKKDLAEFGTTIQKETEKAIEKTSLSLSKENTEQATTKVKAGITSFLGNISKVLVIPPSDEYVPVKVSADGTTLYDRGKARLHAIQMDASTYADPPRGSPEQFEMWLENFEMDQHKGEISEILVSMVEVRALYTRLVPNEVSHAEFWQRYFYRVHQLDCDEARKQALMQRADRTHGDSLSWDEDDWSGGEEDDGNQSDWEKLARPPKQPAAAETEISTSETPHNDPSPSAMQNSPDELDQKDLKNTSIDNAANPECQTLSTSDSNNLPCPTDFSEEDKMPTVHDHFSADKSSRASEEPEKVPKTEHAPDTLRLQVSVETACASVEQEQQPAPEPGSPAEVKADARDSISLSPVCPPCSESNAAAASGLELSSPSLDESNNTTTGDAACGAAEISSASTPSLSTHHESSASPLSDLALTACKDTPRENSHGSNENESASISSSVLKPEYEGHTDQNDESVNLRETGCCELKDEGTAAQAVPEKSHCGDPELAMRVKGDMVVVGETGTVSSDSSDAKGLEDDWEEDFDVELTEEDLKAAEDIAKKLGENLDTEDDWESWD